MIKNELMLLKTENEKQVKKLKEEDKQVIKNIMKKMNIFKVNSYDAQVIKRDLLGMAQELNLRGESLKDEIEDSTKEFVKEVINNSSGYSKREILINFLSKLSGYFFTWFILLSLLAYGGFFWKVNLILLPYFFVIVLLTFIIEGIVTPLFITEDGLKKNIPSLISTLLFITLTLLAFYIRDIHQVKEISSFYIILVSAVGYLISKFLNRKNIHRLAKGKRNYINDLR